MGSARGFLRGLIQTAQNGAAVSAGRGVTNLVASKIPFGQTSPIAQGAIKLAVAQGLGMLTRKVLKSDRLAAMVAAGGASAAIDTALVPMLPAGVKGLFGLSSWPMAVGRGGMSSYAALNPGRPSAGALGVTPRVQEVWESDDGGFSDGIMS